MGRRSAGGPLDSEDTVIDMSASPLPTGAIAAWHSIQASPSLIKVQTPAGLYDCLGTNAGEFGATGPRTNGDVPGEWTIKAKSACDIEMLEMTVQLDLLKDGAAWFRSGTRLCNDCEVIRTDVIRRKCASCKGTWRAVSTHNYTFPAGSVLIDYDAGKCQLITALSVQCVLRSGRLII